MKTRSIVSTSVLILGLALSILTGCNAPASQPTCSSGLIYNLPVGNGSMIPVGTPAVPTPPSTERAILVSDQPILHFPLSAQGPTGTRAPTDSHPQPPAAEAPDFNVTVNSPYGTPHRSVQVDLLIPQDNGKNRDPYTELQLAWNSQLVISYSLTSFETRVLPSSNPGVTLFLDVVEIPLNSALSIQTNNLAILSAWKSIEHTLLQQGPGEQIIDPSPFDLDQVYGPVDMPAPDNGNYCQD